MKTKYKQSSKFKKAKINPNSLIHFEGYFFDSIIRYKEEYKKGEEINFELLNEKLSDSKFRKISG